MWNLTSALELIILSNLGMPIFFQLFSQTYFYIFYLTYNLIGYPQIELRLVWIAHSRPRLFSSRVFSFFFLKDQCLVHCSCDMNSPPRHMNNKKRVNNNFSHIYKLFCYSIFSFQQNKLYPNGPLVCVWDELNFSITFFLHF